MPSVPGERRKYFGRAPATHMSKLGTGPAFVKGRRGPTRLRGLPPATPATVGGRVSELTSGGGGDGATGAKPSSCSHPPPLNDSCTHDAEAICWLCLTGLGVLADEEFRDVEEGFRISAALKGLGLAVRVPLFLDLIGEGSSCS